MVISIIGLLSSVVFTSLSSAKDKARLASGKAQSAQLYRGFGADAGFMFEFEEAAGNSVDAMGGGSCVLAGNTARSNDTPSGAGRSLQLVDGLGDHCSFGLVAGGALVNSMNEGSRYTFSVWYKPAGNPQNTWDGYILYRQGFHGGIALTKAANRPFGLIWYADNTNLQLLGSALQTDKWYHLALAVDTVGNVAELFVDGKSASRVNLDSAKNVKTFTEANSFFVGGSTGGYDGYGLIDEARFYTHAFSLSEAESVYAEGLKKIQFARQ